MENNTLGIPGMENNTPGIPGWCIYLRDTRVVHIPQDIPGCGRLTPVIPGCGRLTPVIPGYASQDGLYPDMPLRMAYSQFGTS